MFSSKIVKKKKMIISIVIKFSFHISGNLITDAMIDYHTTFSHPNDTWAPASIALWNGGGIRASIPIGKRQPFISIQFKNFYIVYHYLDGLIHFLPRFLHIALIKRITFGTVQNSLICGLNGRMTAGFLFCLWFDCDDKSWVWHIVTSRLWFHNYQKQKAQHICCMYINITNLTGRWKSVILYLGTKSETKVAYFRSEAALIFSVI